MTDRSRRCSKNMTIRLCSAVSLVRGQLWLRGCWPLSARIAIALNLPPKSSNFPVSLRLPRKVARPAGSTGVGPVRSSCVKASRSSPLNPFSNPFGRAPTISSSDIVASLITLPCELWLTSGSASSSAAGKIAHPTMKRRTSRAFSSEAPLWPQLSKQHEPSLDL